MGTSGSSPGPGGGVPFDPPWLDNIDTPQPGDGQPPDAQVPADNNGSGDEPPGSLPERPTETPGVAPQGRFRNARRELGSFVRTGDQGALRKALGHYSHSGMGGARNIANRMRVSAISGASAFSSLKAAREKTDPAINQWVDSLTARNANVSEIADEIIKLTMPGGGSLDETNCQQSMAQALGDLIENDPGINLLSLSDDKIWTLIKSFLGHQAFQRLYLDIGQIFEKSTLNPRERVIRMNEMRDYLKSELSVQVDLLRVNTANATPGTLKSIMQRAIENTFFVYEGSI